MRSVGIVASKNKFMAVRRAHGIAVPAFPVDFFPAMSIDGLVADDFDGSIGKNRSRM